MQIKTPLAVSIGLLLSFPTLAENTFRQHDAHVHGHVEFNIAQDGDELLIEVTAPGADVVGFEHAPQNDQQKEALASAIKTLEDTNNIFTLNASANCHVEFKSVTHTLGSGEHDDHHNHDHDKHDHDSHDHDKHDHDKHDHDSHDHDDHDDHEGHDHSGGHGEFTVEYHFHCDDINKLQSISADWFSHFEGTESISVNLLTDKAQSATKLTPASAVISF
ncbi:DUF2796 domain-containing protein [uncultured Vibrio sp.]|uniref:zinc uptake protein ZrgA n=1 Tax=uncultured Vibrio sp. TaxID=114054 RepID=UPI00091F6B2C|nr:DUF2796 domain-containing protein [uncultured Vibrio sp.]OIQ24694.1 MAG: zinc-binding protein [Vibrio sp. MedPE-SWchi]